LANRAAGSPASCCSTFINRSCGSLAPWTSASPLSARRSGYSMFDWPEQSQTSPTATSFAAVTPFSWIA
jgi:hypothetical protein